ncbi:MAG: hypothetical protein PWP68_898, partial [Rikenellaceae bacterium]|nr:hypothetical protein [Rikenellaceae bacterium]
SGTDNYSWSTGGNTASITVTPSSTTTYTVTGTSAAGCTGTATVSVTVNPLPTVSIDSSQSSICIGASATLIANSNISGTSFIWSNNFSGNSITVAPSTITTYSVTGTTNEGCIGTAEITVTVHPLPTINYTTNLSHCGHSDGNIITNVTGGTPPYVYQWSNGANTPNLNNISSGNYNLTVIDANGCSITINMTIVDAQMPVANFIAKPSITTIEDPMIYFQNLSSGASLYYWDFGDGFYSVEESTTHMYNEPNNYYVILYATDEYGCTDTVGGEIIIRDIYTFYLPNAFTPNGNDLNEQYTIIGNNIDPSNFEMRIFDRWGKEIFYTTDINQGWDGYFKGEPVPDGVYVVRVSFKILGTDDVKHIIKEIVVIR